MLFAPGSMPIPEGRPSNDEARTDEPVPGRKRKVTYPPARTATKRPPPAGAGPEPTFVRPTVAAIDVKAAAGQKDLSVGDRVRIVGGGLYSGESAVIERFAGGVIPAALVRTEAGRTRQVRTIDLERIAGDA
jgi:hypothetical protein